MRVAYLSGAYIPSQGANSMQVMGMCQAMAQAGHEVTLHARHGDLEVENDFDFYGVEPIFSLSKETRPQVKAWGALVDALRTRKAVLTSAKPDLIYARETWALSLATDLGVPFIYESHWPPRSMVHRIAEARLLRHPLLSRVVFISEALRSIYLEMFHWLANEKTIVAHDAANLAPTLRGPSSMMSGREEALQVGYVGSFQFGSGIELIAEIAMLLPDDDFHVFGGSSQEVVNWSERSSKIANLKFHGFVSPSNLPAIYGAMDTMVAPYQAGTRSIDWASPMKLFEYMAHGKAIICSDFPVFREVLEQDVTGILVRSDCPREWVRAIEFLRDNAQVRSRLAKAGRDSLRDQFTWRARVDRILNGSLLHSTL